MNQRAPETYNKQIHDRKKSHELNSVRYKKNTDDDRLNKYRNFSMTRQLEKQRHLSITTGRDDPGNVLGYQKLKPNAQPATMKNAIGAHRKNSQLDPIINRGEVKSGEKVQGDKLTTTVQKNIYGMLNDLNRAKTMRIANQILKD